MFRRFRFHVLLALLSAAVFLAASLTSPGRPARADSATPGPDYALYSPTTTVVRNNDGTLTADIHSTPVQTVDPSSPTGWDPIDLSLQATSGGYEPDNADAQVTFSDGGNDAASVATLAQNDTSLSVGLDAADGVPAPVVEGDTATYPDVAPGVDATLRATAAGFETSYVVASAADAPATLDIPLQLNGLNASLAIDGSLILTDNTGTQLGGADPAKMWGAQVDPVTGEPTVQETVPATLIDGTDGLVLQLTPDWTTPGLTFPATIDPTVNLSLLLDTSVSEDFPTISYGTATTLRSGRWSTSQRYRSYIGFDRATIANTHIQAATLTLHETGSASCTGTRIDLMSVTSGPQPPYTWNSQPAVGSVYASTTAAKGFSSSCPAGDITLSTGGDSSHTLIDLVQLWANDTTTPAIIGLRAHEETSSANNTGKIFSSSDAASNGPVLSVTYSYPQVPNDVSVTDAGLSPVTFHATFTDSDPSATGWIQYTLTNPAGIAVVNAAQGSTAVSSGSDSAYTVPTGTLSLGTTFTVKARAFDGTVSSDWSASTSYYYGEVPSGLSFNSSATDFVVQCAYGYQLKDDPIRYPNTPNGSPAQDFFGSPRASAQSSDTLDYQEQAVVNIATADKDPNDHQLAIFTSSDPVSFQVGQLIYVHGVTVSSYSDPLANDYNTTVSSGPWAVQSVDPGTHTFTADVNGTRTEAGDRPSGSAGDAGVHWASINQESYDATTGMGTFTLTSGSVPFVANQDVIVRSGSPYDGLWTFVSASGSTFTATTNTAGLSSGTTDLTGTAADLGLTCGKTAGNVDPGALSYDSAAYWVPSFYTNNGATFVAPTRQREYYTGVQGPECPPDTQCMSQFQNGMQIVAGNSAASQPSDNPHVYWTCGRKTSGTVLYLTPALDHPYECSHFHDISVDWNFIDGPVGIVDLPQCWTGTGSDPTQVSYPDLDNGSASNDMVCDGDFPKTLPHLSIRTHIGGSFLTQPCSVTCRAYVVTGISGSLCGAAICPVTVTVDSSGPPPTFTRNVDYVDLFGVPNGPSTSQEHYLVTAVSGDTITINVPAQLSLPVCPSTPGSSSGCGTIADDIAWNTVLFTLAGGDCITPSNCTHTHPFYQLQAAFWNTWSQEDLQVLVEDCLILGTTACLNHVPGEAEIANNKQVDCIAAGGSTAC